MYTSCKIWKNPLKYQFVCSFTTLDLIWPKFCLKDHTHFAFLADFWWSMLGGTININKLCCNPAVLKKSWTQFAQKRSHYGPHPRWKKNFFGRNLQLSESSSALRKFLFYQNIWFNWVMNLCLSWVMFSISQKCHFQLKQLWRKLWLTVL